jgi:small subunit ribosomal protein S17
MPRRVLEGYVTSDKQDKTVTVRVERRFMHPMYKKYVKRSDKYRAHDESNSAKEGQLVQIRECRPVSRNKTWEIVESRKQDGDSGDDSTAKQAQSGGTSGKSAGSATKTSTSSSSKSGSAKSSSSSESSTGSKTASSKSSSTKGGGSSKSGASKTASTKSSSAKNSDKSTRSQNNDSS